jgi:hypothetical protein
MDTQFNASGYSGSGSNLVMPPMVSDIVMSEYRCDSPLGRMANWNGDPRGDLLCNSKVYYETTQGLTADEVCDDTNGQVTHLHQSFLSDYMELCVLKKYTLKKDEVEAIRMCNRWNTHQFHLFEDLKYWIDKASTPFALMKLLASAHPNSKGLNAIGIPSTGAGVAAGLGDINNPIKVDVTSPRNGGNIIQPNSITTNALIARLKQNLFAQGVLCSTSQLMIAGGGNLEAGFTVDQMCSTPTCTLTNTGMKYEITSWMPSATNAAGNKVDYVVMFDPNKFWFQLHQLYLKWVAGDHHQSLNGATLFGAKVANPKAVSVAAVQFV